MKKIYYRKLIRDKIPLRIQQDGGDFKITILSRTAFMRELIKKVEEEASGLKTAKKRPDLILELDDILAVIEEIIKTKKITHKEMARARRANKVRKGGFKKRLYLHWTTPTGYRTNEKKGKTP